MYVIHSSYEYQCNNKTKTKNTAKLCTYLHCYCNLTKKLEDEFLLISFRQIDWIDLEIGTSKRKRHQNNEFLN